MSLIREASSTSTFLPAISPFWRSRDSCRPSWISRTRSYLPSWNASSDSRSSSSAWLVSAPISFISATVSRAALRMSPIRSLSCPWTWTACPLAFSMNCHASWMSVSNVDWAFAMSSLASSASFVPSAYDSRRQGDGAFREGPHLRGRVLRDEDELLDRVVDPLELVEQAGPLLEDG